MRIFEVRTGNMTAPEAIAIFSKYGVDPRGMDDQALKIARRQLMMTNHADRGGANGAAQEINAAYDVLSQLGTGNAETHTSQPDYRDNNYYGGHYRPGNHDRSWEEY